ncbi:hypothetical protein V8F06_006878 [Rhypophila decipiens]
MGGIHRPKIILLLGAAYMATVRVYVAHHECLLPSPSYPLALIAIGGLSLSTTEVPSKRRLNSYTHVYICTPGRRAKAMMRRSNFRLTTLYLRHPLCNSQHLWRESTRWRDIGMTPPLHLPGLSTKLGGSAGPINFPLDLSVTCVSPLAVNLPAVGLAFLDPPMHVCCPWVHHYNPWPVLVCRSSCYSAQQRGSYMNLGLDSGDSNQRGNVLRGAPAATKTKHSAQRGKYPLG